MLDLIKFYWYCITGRGHFVIGLGDEYFDDRYNHLKDNFVGRRMLGRKMVLYDIDHAQFHGVIDFKAWCKGAYPSNVITLVGTKDGDSVVLVPDGEPFPI